MRYSFVHFPTLEKKKDQEVKTWAFRILLKLSETAKGIRCQTKLCYIIGHNKLGGSLTRIVQKQK